MNKKKIMSLLLSAIIITSTAIGSSSIIAKADSQKTYNHRRISGANRIETALAVATEYNNTKLNNVVLATAYNFPDALTGSVLASKLNAPILLVGKTVTESSKVMDFIKAHLNTNGNVYILGGTGVISDEFTNYLKSNSFSNINRLGGSNREETAKLIGNTVNAAQGTPVVIATENDFPDALSISSIAALKQYPILLSTKTNLPQTTKDILNQIKPSTVYVVGGTGVLTDNVLSDVKAVTGLSNDKIVRISGKDRYETSLNVAKAFNLNTTNVFVATGSDFPDALSGSVLAAKNNAPILLMDNSNITSQKQYLDSTGINSITILGGTGAIASNTEDQISTATTSSNQSPTPSIGMQTSTGLVTNKITYTDSEISDNPTLEQMTAMSTLVTADTNPDLFVQGAGQNWKTLNWGLLNLTGKIIHAQWTVHLDGLPDGKVDFFVKILDLKANPDGMRGPEIDKTYTSVSYINGQLGQLLRHNSISDINREQWTYLANEK